MSEARRPWTAERLDLARARCRGNDAWARWAKAWLPAAPPTARQGRGRWDEAQAREQRVALGQVFTPPDVARKLATLVPLEGSVLDPACGDGELLIAVAARRAAAGRPVGEILAELEGWDRDPVAAWACTVALVEWAVDTGRTTAAPPPAVGPRVCHTDALWGDRGQALVRGGGVDAVISNPPYLEAKRMRRAEPGLRERLKQAFPELTGAFDLYLVFCWQALRWVRPGGHVALLVPNKICQGRYAASFRQHVGKHHQLRTLVDLARMHPRAFPGTGVYPVLVELVRGPGTTERRGQHVLDASTLHDDPVRVGAWPDVSPEAPWFVPFPTGHLLEPLLELPRLGDVAVLRSTCSFHRRGLRERYVVPDKPSKNAHPYLGGPSRSRQTEVDLYQLRWAGWWIDFDVDSLRNEHGNPLPPLELFTQPKVVFCQHARRMKPWVDAEGRFVTKDVYPIAVPREAPWSVNALAAVLGSTVFTALYNTVFQGIVVGGATYHYLPAFLKWVPVPRHGPWMEEADALLAAAHQPEVALRLDRLIADAYGVDEEARRALVEEHLTSVGEPAPGEAAERA